jgi:hypothetical protein
MTPLSFLPTGLIIFLLWASLAGNIVLLLWISINGNMAKRMEKLLSLKAETNRHNSELAKELLKEMSTLSKINEAVRAVNGKLYDKHEEFRTELKRNKESIIMLSERVSRYEKIIVENGWELDLG